VKIHVHPIRVDNYIEKESRYPGRVAHFQRNLCHLVSCIILSVMINSAIGIMLIVIMSFIKGVKWEEEVYMDQGRQEESP